MLSKILFFLLLSIGFQNLGYSQEGNFSTSKSKVYYELATGLNLGKYRDFATSPLIYDGAAFVFSIDRLKINSAKESTFGVYYSQGIFTAEVDGFSEGASLARSTGIHFSKLYRLEKFSNDIWNVKLGGAFSSISNLRLNPSLLNNQFGFENISTLFLSTKVERNINRTKRRKGKIWFIKYSLPPRERTLSFALNLGTVNSSFRNGYIYSNQSSLLNDFQPFYDYEFDLFSGYRIGSSFSYTHFLKNSNALMLSYKWDVANTGGEINRFEMASHMLKFSILFNTK